MRSKFRLIFTFLLVLSIQFLFAQMKTVSGIVSDSEGSLPGVNVFVKGSKNGTQTNTDGKYSISAKQGDVLVFTFLGMKTMSSSVGASNIINIKMSSDAQDLGEVVVEGYKTIRKAKSTNATTTITASTIEGKANASFIQTLQGQVAGLNIATGSGQPGSNSTVILRGAGSINGNIEPLYVIDGVPLNVDNFRSINPSDIESVSVLKDAGATAIYGNRGGNGVILVTTKKGSFNSPLKIGYSSVTGFTYLQKDKYNVMNTSELLATEKLYGTGIGSKNDATIDNYKNTDTDWKKYFFRTGLSQNHNLSLSSGSENLSSFTSIGYFNQEGILKTTDLNRFNFRNNLNGRSANKKITYSTTSTINYSRRNEATSIGDGGVNQNYILGANNSLPYINPSSYVNGQQVLDLYNNSEDFEGTLGLTPLFLVDKLNTAKFRTEELKIILSGNIDFEITKNLSFGTSAGIDYTQANNLNTESPTSFNGLYFAEQGGYDYGGFQSEAFSRDFQFTANNNLTYSTTIGEKSSLVTQLFVEYNKAHFKSFGYTQNGLETIFFSPGNGEGFIGYDNTINYVPEVSAGKVQTGLLSYFANVEYDYDSKYGFEGTIRRDASFRFTDENKWGTFWSVAGRWNLDEENFMEGSKFSILKLRASYGSTGNQNINGQNNYNSTNLYKDLAGTGSSYDNVTAYYLANLGNPRLKWETLTQANLGVDFEVFDKRLNGTIDVYNKTTTDLYQDVPNSAIVGTGGSLSSNFGSMRNRGVELLLNYDLFKSKNNGFNLTLNVNGAYNKNELLELPNENGLIWDGGLLADREGDMLNQWYVIKYAGVNPANGNLLFYNKDSQLTETPNDADRVFTGKSLLPVYQGAFGFDASYKGLFLSTQFNFVADIYRYDYDLNGLQDPTSLGQFNVSKDLLNAWTPNNRITTIPSLKATNLSNDSSSDRYLKDASYIRLRNATIGYKFPKSFLDKTFIKNIKAYFQAENMVTWSKWRGWDAESNRAADQYNYPTPKIVSIGLDIEL